MEKKTEIEKGKIEHAYFVGQNDGNNRTLCTKYVVNRSAAI
jgi:hypothetical protein